MSTADARRIFKFNGTAAQYGVEVFEVLDEDIRSLFQHGTQSRIFDVCRRQAQMDVLPASPIFSERLETKAAIS